MFLILLFVVYVESFLYSMHLLLFFSLWLIWIDGANSTLLYSTLLPSTSPQSKQANNAALGEVVSINPFFFGLFDGNKLIQTNNKLQ